VEDNFEWLTEPRIAKKFAIKTIIKLGEIIDLLEKRNPEARVTKREYNTIVKEIKPMLVYITEALIRK